MSCLLVIAQAFASAATAASFSATAHCSQQTSTGLPPTFTVTAVLSNGQSQAAQVFLFKVFLHVRTASVEVEKARKGAERAVRIFSDLTNPRVLLKLDRSLAIGL